MFDKRKVLPLALALGLSAAPFAVVPAVAQDQTLPAPAEEPALQAPSYDEEKLRSFVVAFLEVNKVGEQYRPQIEAAAADEAEQTRIREEVSGMMVEAVENTDGITVEEYSTILASAQTDPQLAQELNVLIRENVEAGGAEAPPPPQ